MAIYLCVIFRISSKVLLSTLSVSVAAGKSELETYLNHDDTAHEKAKRLSALLGLQSIPSRQFLIKEMVSQCTLFSNPETCVRF